jgi:cytochrome c-type biogenesis protein CcmH
MMTRIFLVLFILALAVVPAAAQDSTITDDDVNDVAEQLYCPVCENIPLDVCPTAACADWREEIRVQLSQGYSNDQIIADFINRFGQRVVGTPQDPVLRSLSLVTPWLIGIIITIIAGLTFARWSRSRPGAQVAAGPAVDVRSDDDYRQQIERDLLARR